MPKPNFIDKLLDFTQYAESPTSYFEWTAFTTIAAVLRDHVYIKYPHYTLYPNLYTILLSAESSNTRKSVPLNIAKALIKSVDNTHLVSGTATMPSVVRLLGEPFISKGNVTYKGASGIILASELTSFIKKDFDAIETLTDLYDFHEEWDARTKNAGTSLLKRVCLSMVAGTNEALIEDLYDEKAKEGGLLARSCIIYEKKRRLMNSLEFEQPKLKIQFEDLVKELRQISALSGELQRSTESRKIFDDWYRQSLHDEKLSKTGAEGRIHDIVRKIAMILCLAENPPNDNKIITGEHMEKAIDYGVYLLKNQREFAIGAGRGFHAASMKLVLKMILTAPQKMMTRKKLLQNLLGDVSLEDLDKIIVHGTEAEVLETVRAPNGDLALKATESFIAKIEGRIEHKKKEKKP